MENNGKTVIVRTLSAGVHIGVQVRREGKEIVLHNAQRIWRWRGANTLNEMATHGINSGDYSRVSEKVPSITLTEAIEIIPCSAFAEDKIRSAGWAT